MIIARRPYGKKSLTLPSGLVTLCVVSGGESIPLGRTVALSQAGDARGTPRGLPVRGRPMRCVHERLGPHTAVLLSKGPNMKKSHSHRAGCKEGCVVAELAVAFPHSP